MPPSEKLILRRAASKRRREELARELARELEDRVKALNAAIHDATGLPVPICNITREYTKAHPFVVRVNGLEMEELKVGVRENLSTEELLRVLKCKDGSLFEVIVYTVETMARFKLRDSLDMSNWFPSTVPTVVDITRSFRP